MERFIEFFFNNWVLFLALAMVLLWIALSEGTRSARGVRTVNTTEATNLYNRHDALFLDIRSEAEFNKGHLPGALNIPNGRLDKHQKRLHKQKKKPVVLYCKQGLEAAKVGKKLKEEGFEEVCQLKGGYASWHEQNLPVESK